MRSCRSDQRRSCRFTIPAVRASRAVNRRQQGLSSLLGLAAIHQFRSRQRHPMRSGRSSAKPRQGLQGRLRQAPGTNEPRMLSEVFQNYQILPLQRSFEGRRINISMTHHLFPLVADMLADFILYPTSTELRQSPDDPLVRAEARRAVPSSSDCCKRCSPDTGTLSLSTASIMIRISAGSSAIAVAIRLRSRCCTTSQQVIPAPAIRQNSVCSSHKYRWGNRMPCRTWPAYSQ